MCEITFFISLTILGLFGANQRLFGDDPGLQIPLQVAFLACFTAAAALAAYIWIPKNHAYAYSLVPFLMLTATVWVLCRKTGALESAYLPLWMLTAVFSGIFGRFGLGILTVMVVTAFCERLFFTEAPLYRREFIMIILAGGVPLITSYLIWHERTAREGRKQTMDALAKQLWQEANKSDIVITSIADGVIAIDKSKVVQLLNPAAQQILGWESQDALQLDYHSIFRLHDAKGNNLPDGLNPIEQVLGQNKPVVTNNLSLVTQAGKHLDISLVVSPVPSQGNKVGGAIAVFRDITDQKRRERAQTEFISTASHEMRTPVAAIEGYLSLALNPATAGIDDKARAYLNKAHESTQHLGRLFQDLLTVSRAEDGRLAPKPVVVDVISFVREISDSLLPKALAKDLSLQFLPGGGSGVEGARTIPPAYYSYVDRDHLREVISNLVDNAIKYTKQGGVALDITSTDDSITIGITDTGIGIPPEDVAHLFQKFYRVDESYTREVGGTGLGLYICRRLIETNNGKVWAESDYGHGSTFYVQIPRITHEKASALKESSAAHPGAPAVLTAPAAKTL